LPAKADRLAAAAALDAMLPQPFERSAVNGFGLPAGGAAARAAVACRS
jgi:hypothetical protein